MGNSFAKTLQKNSAKTLPPEGAQGWIFLYYFTTSSNSTSKISGVCGGIALPAPLSP